MSFPSINDHLRRRGFIHLEFGGDFKRKKEKVIKIAEKDADQLKEKYEDSSVEVQKGCSSNPGDLDMLLTHCYRLK